MMGQYLALLAAHFVGDFVLQTHWQASNKSKNNAALIRHVLIYTACLAAAAVLLFGPSPQWFAFVWLNYLLHVVTDAITSRATARLWAKQEWHNFFVVIGLDQFIHQVTLGATMLLFFGSGA